MPVTIMAGALDRVVDPADHSVRLHRELPHSRLILVPGYGHMVHHAAVDSIADAVAMRAGVANEFALRAQPAAADLPVSTSP